MEEETKIKSIIVTGGAGLVGSHLVPALLKEDPICRVKVLDNLKRGFREYVPDDARIEFFQVDLKYLEEIEDHFKNADEVFHLASVVGGIENVFNNEANVFLDTCMINLNVLQLCKKYNENVKRVLYISSACCYPKGKQDFRFKEDGSVDFNYLKEEDVYPAEPESGYGMAKLHGEQLCEKLLDEGVYQIVRLHNLYGPKMQWDSSSQVVASLIKKVLLLSNSRDRTLTVWGRGKQYRDFIFINDAIRGILEVYKQNPTHKRIVQLGSGHATTVTELARSICNIHRERCNFGEIEIVSI